MIGTESENFNKKRLLVWILPLSIAAVIFLFSSQTGDASEELSNDSLSGLLGVWGLKSLLENGYMAHLLLLLIRKAAHIAEFTAFFMSLLISFFVSAKRGVKYIRISMLITFLYASSDEFHQLFVTGRTAKISDVVIDSVVPLFLTFIICFLLERRGNHPPENR